MRVRDIAAKLDVSPSTIYQLIAEGKLRCTRHGVGRGCIRVSPEQLAEYEAEAEGREADRRPLRYIK